MRYNNTVFENELQMEGLLSYFFVMVSGCPHFHFIYMNTCALFVKEDISRLVEEGQLDFKLNELDKLEHAAKNNPNSAW